MARVAGVWVVRILLAGFFGFVGYMKSTASMADLQRYHAWVADLPPGAARAVGWSELVCAVCLLLPRLPWLARRPWPTAALVLLFNQLVAIAFHAQRGELEHSLAQNLVLIALLALLWRSGAQGVSGRVPQP